MRSIYRRIGVWCLLIIAAMASSLSAADIDLYGVREEHVMIPMRDGTKLSAYLYFPPEEGQYPVIYEQRYADLKGAATRQTYARLAKAGFVVCGQNFRGSALSEGTWVGYRALGWGALQAPDDQRVVEQATLLEVGDQRSCGLIDIFALASQCVRQSEVVVPAHVEQLGESHIPLGESPGEQAVGRIRARTMHIGAVQVEDVLWFALEVEQFRHAGLHPEGHFILSNASLDLGVTE